MGKQLHIKTDKSKNSTLLSKIIKSEKSIWYGVLYIKIQNEENQTIQSLVIHMCKSSNKNKGLIYGKSQDSVYLGRWGDEDTVRKELPGDK